MMIKNRLVILLAIFSSCFVICNEEFPSVQSSTNSVEEAQTLSGQLSNGLTYYIHRNPNSKRHVRIDLIAKAGSIHEEDDERGICHLVEHMIVRRLKYKGVFLLDEECPIWKDSYNPDIRTFSSYEFTQFQLGISYQHPDGLESGLRTLADISKDLKFTDIDLEEEKQDIINEIHEEKSPVVQRLEQARLAYEYLQYTNKYPGGTTKSISQLTLESCDNFYKKWYQPNRIAVIVVGNIDLSRTKELIEQLFGDIPNLCHETALIRKNIPSAQKSFFVHFDPNLKETQFSLFKPLSEITPREYMKYSLATKLIGAYLEKRVASKNVHFSNPILETLTFPFGYRMVVTLPYDLYWDAIDELRLGLASFSKSVSFEHMDQATAKMKKNLLKISPEILDHSLKNHYRNLFVRGQAFSQACSPQECTSLLDSITLEELRSTIQFLTEFSVGVVSSNDFLILENLKTNP